MRGAAKFRLALAFVAAIAACAVGSPTSSSTSGVSPAEPTQLAILDVPDLPTEGISFPVALRVELRDVNGVRVANATNTVTLTVGANSAGSLGGQTTVAAVAGIATFSGLSLDKAGPYTLVASSGTLASATSAQFRVTLHFAAISPNDQHTCGLTASAETFCWGFNWAGQLGDGTQTSRLLPTPVLVPAGLHFSAVSAGLEASTCARTPAGAAYCWGDGEKGQNGFNTLFVTAPAKVTLPTAAPVIAIDAGFEHACALVAGGAAFCWGDGHPAPAAVAQPGGLALVSISSAVYANCGLDAAGAGWCWGNNENGQLGDGTQINRPSPTKVLTPAGVSFVTLVTAGLATCGLTAGGAIYCWGENDKGQVGDGTETLRLTPVQVHAPPGVSFSRLSVGLSSACGIATSGTTYCWGNNAGNQLGDGTGNHRVLPTAVLVPPGVSFVEISVGADHACGLTSIGAAYCWGQNEAGELGDGTTMLSKVPVRVIR